MVEAIGNFFEPAQAHSKKNAQRVKMKIGDLLTLGNKAPWPTVAGSGSWPGVPGRKVMARPTKPPTAILIGVLSGI